MNLVSIAIEKLVLGLCLMESSIVPMIDRELLYKTRHKIIYDVIRKYYDDGKNIDLAILYEELKDNDSIEPSYIASLLDGVPNTSIKYIDEHLEKLRELKKKRDVRSVSLGITFALERGDNEKLTEHLNVIKELTNSGEKASTITAKELINEYDEFKDKGGGVGIGLPTFDGESSGIASGEVAYLLGRAKVIKSIFAQNSLRFFAERYPLDGAVFFSLEMSPPQLGERLLQIESGKPIYEITDEEKDKIIERHSNIFYVTKAAMSLSNIYSTIVSMKYKANIRLVVIDFLTRIRTEIPGEYDFLRNATKFIKDMAKELDIAMLVLTQVGREWGGNGDIPLSLRSGRGSGTIEEDADFIFGAYRPELGKNRYTPESLEAWKDLVVIQCLGARRIRKIDDMVMKFDKKCLRLTQIQTSQIPTRPKINKKNA